MDTFLLAFLSISLAVLITLLAVIILDIVFKRPSDKVYCIIIIVLSVIYIVLGLSNIVSAFGNKDNKPLEALLDFISVLEIPILFLLIDKVLLNNRDTNKDIEKQPQQDTSNIKNGKQAAQDIEKTLQNLQSDIKKIQSVMDTLQPQISKINDNLTPINTELAKLKGRTDSTTPEDETTKDKSSAQQS